jgi:alkanesulfonate monooxygenase SsuD/methylene tetrahydromethanopterin reductase-like flavin-dependent oxidoreductase (luciferase family)
MTAVPSRRLRTIDVAVEAERRGFSGLYCPTFGDGLAMCQSIAAATRTIRFGTSIANIYTRHAVDYAQTAAFIHEISNGRFLFGIGVSHAAVNDAMGLRTGKPLADMRGFVESYRRAEKRVGSLPPLVMATLRLRMVALSAEIGDGAVWANAARSHMSASLSSIETVTSRNEFFVGNMIPTCVSEDRAAAGAVLRRVLRMYVRLPNYQKYWEEAGYVEEMAAIRAAIAGGDQESLDTLMHDRWLSDVTLYGTAKQIRDGVEQWRASGVKEPILVPSSVNGGQMKALAEIFEVFDD